MQFIRNILGWSNEVTLEQIFNSHIYSLYALKQVLENIDIVMMIIKIRYLLRPWSLYAANEHCVLDTGDTVYGYGSHCELLKNSYSRPGILERISIPKYKCVTCSMSCMYIITEENTVSVLHDTRGFMELGSLGIIKKITCDGFSVYLLTDEGLLHTFAKSLIKSDIIDIECGYHYIMALDNQGKLYGWGGNTSGQLGLGHSDVNIIEPTLIDVPLLYPRIICGNSHSFLLSNEGIVYACGNNVYGILGLSKDKMHIREFTKLDFFKIPVKAVACGNKHTLFLLTNKIVYGSLGL